jgi:renal tumor antigen
MFYGELKCVIDRLIMENYKIEGKKGEGTYSEVFSAASRLDGHKYALKVMKHRYSNIDKIKKDKEIKALKTLCHPHIIKLIDVLYDASEGN